MRNLCRRRRRACVLDGAHTDENGGEEKRNAKKDNQKGAFQKVSPVALFQKRSKLVRPAPQGNILRRKSRRRCRRRVVEKQLVKSGFCAVRRPKGNDDFQPF
ncbi:hypothetical protein FACS1894205_4030 [Alphaproteobacteria bacterium]|nr:hypothetical protein FACS1894205_4030 [Alphaproteobacteria bacterium]